MKTIFIFLVSILLAVPAPNASGDEVTATFTLRNSTSYNLGVVLLNHSSGSPDSLDVGGYGTYAAQVDASVASITINGQPLSYPTVSLVTLPNGTVVRVRWQSAAVVIVDTNEF